jgi:hypothetical protein
VHRLSEDSIECRQLESNSAQDRKVLVILAWDSPRLRAAECVFSMAVKGIEIEDTETRLSELEQAAEASTKQKK